MRFSTTTVVAALATSASAYITGIKVPETIKAGETITVNITRANYIQAVYDGAALFGIDESMGQIRGALGEPIYAYALTDKDRSPDFVNGLIPDLPVQMKLPTGIKNGEVQFVFAPVSGWGVGFTPSVSNFRVNITVGDETSKTYKSSYDN
jgi:hypothetical protein